MSNSRKTFSIIVVLSLVLLAILFYPSYSRWSARRAELAAENKFFDLSHLVIDERDCPTAIQEAKSFLITNSGAVQVWSILGACQFDMGEFADAKVTFNKVLALDSEHSAAKNYLRRMEFKDGEVMVTSVELPLDKDKFESSMGADFDDVLTFVKAARKPASIPEYLFAAYSTSAIRTDVVEALKTKLEASGLPVTISETDTSTIIAAGDDKEIKVIQMSKGTGALITIGMNYQKLQ